jgi:16S rRNA processing protein RimM
LDAADVDATSDDEPLVMGRIAAPFGVRGWLRVAAWSEDPVTLLSYRTWSIRKKGDAWRSVEVVEARPQSPGLVALLRGIGSREEAAALRGCEVGVPRAALAALKAGEIYWTDLIGLEVVNREGTALGRVAEVSGYGAHPVLHVTGEGEAERLIPFVPSYVERVDVAGGRIDVDWQPDY